MNSYMCPFCGMGVTDEARSALEDQESDSQMICCLACELWCTVEEAGLAASRWMVNDMCSSTQHIPSSLLTCLSDDLTTSLTTMVLIRLAYDASLHRNDGATLLQSFIEHWIKDDHDAVTLLFWRCQCDQEETGGNIHPRTPDPCPRCDHTPQKFGAIPLASLDLNTLW